MTKFLSWMLVIGASLGLVNVHHAIFYEHPELLFGGFYRRDLDELS